MTKIMKKSLFTFAVLATIVVGCKNKELQPVTPEVNDGTYTFKALISDAVKTSINGQGTMAWITGDQIEVYDGAFETFTLNGEASGAEAIFTGDLVNPEAANFALCPKGIGSEVAGEMLTLVLPASYSYDGQSTHAPMIASGFTVNGNETTIKFKHMGGLFKVTYNNIPDEAKYFCFESDNKQIAGEFYIEDYTVTNLVIEVGDDPSKGNSVSYEIPAEHESSMTFYVPVPVGTFNFNISLRDAENNKIAKSSKTKNDFTIERNYYVELPAVNMPKTLTENFTANVDDTQYSSSKAFSTADNIKTYDYVWTLTSGSTATVGHDFVKTGKSGNAGSIQNTTMLADIETGTVFTVKVFAANWPAKTTSLSVDYNSKNYSVALTTAPSNADNNYSASDFAEYDFVFQKAEGVNTLVVGGTNERVLIDKIVIAEGGELPKEPQEFSVSTTSLAAAWDETSKTFDITAADVVAWELMADDGLTLSQDEGNGNATITVTFAENTEETQVRKEIVVSTDYSPLKGESEYTIVLTQAGKPSRQMDGNGSAANPYSVADALYLAGNLADNASTAECYVTGTIKTLGTFSSGTYSYTIGTGDDTFEVYKGKDLGNVNFASAEDIAVDQVVVIYGKIKKYVSSQSVTTFEMDANNYLYSINGATSVLTSIAVSGAKTSFTQNEEWSFGGTVTASYRGKANADVTSNATFSGYNTANTGEQTVTASYTENEVTKTAEYTINVVKEGTVQITKVTAEGQFTAGTYIILSSNEEAYLPNTEFTSGAPTKGTVSKTEGVINITRDMVWTATESDGGLVFESLAASGKYVWGAPTNNGVRVASTTPSTASKNVWKAESVGTFGIVAYAGVSGTDKYYLTLYSSQDWRNYKYANSKFGADGNYPANFYKIVGWVDPGVTTYTLTINSTENGSIKATVDGVEVVNGAEIEEGKTVTITATPADSDHEFDSWDVTGATVGTSSTETFTMTGDVTVGATFKEKETPGPGPGPDPSETEKQIYSTTFAYTISGSAYNSSTPISGKDADGKEWTITYGNWNGSKQAEFRLYNSGGGFGTLEQKFDLAKVTKVQYKAKAASSNGAVFKLNTYYSTNGGTSWTKVTSAQQIATDETQYEFSISATGEFSTVRIKFELDSSSTKPTTKNTAMDITSCVIYGMSNN